MVPYNAPCVQLVCGKTANGSRPQLDKSIQMPSPTSYPKDWDSKTQRPLGEILTVSAKVLQQSYWPFFLRSDDSYDQGVRGSVLWISKSIPVLSILLSATSVITPLGLYSSTAAGKPVRATFVHVPDASSFGLHGTMTRANYSVTRACGTVTHAGASFRYDSRPCPLSDDGYGHLPNSSKPDSPCCLDVSLPAAIRDRFSSGFRNTTVSNSLDIQWRQYTLTTRAGYLNGSAFMAGRYRNVQSLLFEETRIPIEGLIVDTIRGGIGFRNHTVPIGFHRPVTWQEDLLFIEPETVCVDTNLTLDYTQYFRHHWGPLPVSRVALTDRGGFSDLDRTMPAVDLSDPQRNADLRGRALAAAWLHNVLSAMWFNVTNPSLPLGAINSTMNQTFPYTNAFMTGYPEFTLSKNFYNEFWVFQNRPGVHVFDRDAVSSRDVSDTFQLRLLNYTLINDLCRGIDESSTAQANNILVSCGLLQGIPRRRDGGDPFLLEDGVQWTKGLYSCASATKATIKTVSLSYNGTGSRFDGLKVTDIKDKQYAGESSMPLWGVEDVGGQYRADEISLIWGLVSPEHEGGANMTTYRQPSLYLPGRMSAGTRQMPSMSEGGNPAGSDFAYNMWLGTYCNTLDLAARGKANARNCDDKSKYGASSNVAMWTKWQKLTASAETASRVPDLIFTDFAASAVLGTKSGSGPGSGTGQASILVTPEILVIRYRLAYGVPAAISAVAVFLIACLSLALTCNGQDGVAGMRKHLQQLAPGRIYTTLLAPQGTGSDLAMRGKDWNRRFGAHVIDLSQGHPMAVHKMVPSDCASEGDPDEMNAEQMEPE
ncbi:hypothetical protein OCS_00583 [Ophiocordyceps sinensis CO18]|uniref:Uncharacterized protein n=1 Tax=Ophiocordyceps sinensis (strain Co18 / CGMCC 3.14243) TaxID=911162 RepID=T5APG7_OPHSC|nr:hypothetical protein OCS_00583 [Ophiocordyceps sinensis CO18]